MSVLQTTRLVLDDGVKRSYIKCTYINKMFICNVCIPISDPEKKNKYIRAVPKGAVFLKKEQNACGVP